jgi:ABC-type transport system involved in multi-copper enzyme maturation permease subunit
VWSATARIFDLSLGQMLWSRRSVLLGVLLGGPVLLAAILRTVAAFFASRFVINGVQVSGLPIFGMMIWLLYIRFIVPILGVFYGTALIADEIEDKTITYLFTRPIPRRAVLFGKYLAYLVCTVLMVLPSVVLVYFLIVTLGPGSGIRLSAIADGFPSLVIDLAMLSIGLASYGAVFAVCRTGLRHSAGNRASCCFPVI